MKKRLPFFNVIQMFFTTVFHKKDFSSLPLKLGDPFSYLPSDAVREAYNDFLTHLDSNKELKMELENGKMIGVLVVKNNIGETGYLISFSGQIFGKNEHDGFVPPVFDILTPDSYYRRGEKEISAKSSDIKHLESVLKLESAMVVRNTIVVEAETRLAEYQEFVKEQKAIRDSLRGSATEEEIRKMNNESSSQKNQLKRLKQEVEAAKVAANIPVDNLKKKIEDLKVERENMSRNLQRRIFRDFRFHNTKGEEKNLLDIFSDEVMPPSGAGECAAPRLLEYAYHNDYQPISMAEFWIGESPSGRVRHSGTYYHACRSKCLPIMNFMLEGVDLEANKLDFDYENEEIKTLYRDEDILVISKPSGLLSVRGKECQTSVETWAEKICADYDGPKIVHRLDQDTSGIMIIALNINAYHNLQKQFETHTIQKKYVAMTETIPSIKENTIILPLAPDVANRPMQMVSKEFGLYAETYYKVIAEKGGKAFVDVYPKTGRTHQIRMHLSCKEGANSPILGDRLYGSKSINCRLMLHAEKITFTHPSTNKEMTFVDKAPFFLT